MINFSDIIKGTFLEEFSALRSAPGVREITVMGSVSGSVL